MGISILSGTITTIGCGGALYGGETVIFRKFAIIITTTISLSFLTAMLFFGALCHTLGPQKNTGDIYSYFYKNDVSEETPKPEGKQTPEI